MGGNNENITIHNGILSFTADTLNGHFSAGPYCLKSKIMGRFVLCVKNCHFVSVTTVMVKKDNFDNKRLY